MDGNLFVDLICGSHVCSASVSIPPHVLFGQPAVVACALVSSVQGEIEYLDKAGIPDNSHDIVISNCVVGASCLWC